MGDARRRSGVGPSGAGPANVEGVRVMRMHTRKAHSARTFERNLPDEWGDPRISPVVEHDENVRHENAKSISNLSNPPLTVEKQLTEAGRTFARVLHLPQITRGSSSVLRNTLQGSSPIAGKVHRRACAKHVYEV